MTTFFLIWQDPVNRRWHPVGRLDRLRGRFLFAYTEGAKRSPRFVAFGNMSAIESIYVAEELFPIFANRVLSEKRPEYHTYARWSGFAASASSDPLLLMARMGGNRATDTLQVYPVPERTTDNYYHTVFFAHGISHLSASSQVRCSQMVPGERLYPMLDVQNPYDPDAVALRTSDPSDFVGYCPRHLAADFRDLMRDDPNALAVHVKQVNLDAPPQFRVLCEVRANWPRHFYPCSGQEYQTIVPYDPDKVLDRVDGEILGAYTPRSR